MSGGEDRTEAPTAKRLAEARRNGQWGRTPDLGAWLGLGAGVMTIPMVVRIGEGHLQAMFDSVGAVASDPDPARMSAALTAAATAVALTVAPLAAVTIAVAIGGATVQGGLKFTTKPLKPQLSRLNPVTGIKGLFDLTRVWQMVKSLLKTAIIGAVLATTIHRLMPTLVSDQVLPLSSVIGTVKGGAASLIRSAVIAGLLLAVVDFAVAQRKLKKGLKMTKQAVKDEHKNSEGNPQVKAAIKSKQRMLTRNRMMSAVATADVLLVNPTHVAVALRYEAGTGAPRVVAKGSGHVAARLRARAAEHGVPMVADVPLARALYAACKLDQEIPSHLYTAVAQVLAFVMALRRRGAASGIHTSPVRTPVAAA